MMSMSAQVLAAETQALMRLEEQHDIPLEAERLFTLDIGTSTGVLETSLEVLQNAHSPCQGETPVQWVHDLLPSLSEEAAMPILKVFLRTYTPNEPWSIPDRIYSSDLMPYYTDLVKSTVISQARNDLYDKWAKEDTHDYEKHGHFTESDVEEMQKEREEEARNPRPPRRYSLHALQRLLGTMPPKEPWTEEEYAEHCAPAANQPLDPCDEYEKYCDDYRKHCEEEFAEYERHSKEEFDRYVKQCEEDEKNGPWCSDCHPQSGCDGDHGDEMRSGVFVRKGPCVSPLTVQTDAEDRIWAENLERLIAESRAIREAPLSTFLPSFTVDEDAEVDLEAA